LRRSGFVSNPPHALYRLWQGISITVPPRQPNARPPSVQHVPNGEHWMAERHSRTCPPHHLPDLLPLVRAIAMHHAVRASRLGVTEQTAFEATLGVARQGSALRAQRLPFVVMAAIQEDHRHQRLEFPRAPGETRVGPEIDQLFRCRG